MEKYFLNISPISRCVAFPPLPCDSVIFFSGINFYFGIFTKIKLIFNKGQAQFRPVKTGIMGETEIEILDGLKEGEEIVTGSYKTLRTLKNEARVKTEMKKERR